MTGTPEHVPADRTPAGRQVEGRRTANGRPASQLRAAVAAETIADLARHAAPGTRLGSRDELRARCGVSVGSLHEALRLLQSTGEIVVRTGPGGGVFAGESSALSALVRSVRHADQAPTDYADVARVMRALSPLIIEDAIAAIDDDGIRRLRTQLDRLTVAAHAPLQDVVRVSLELFATIVGIPPAGALAVVAGAVLRTQLDLLAQLAGATADAGWRAAVDRHVEAAGVLVEAIVARDLDAALAARGRPEFMALFESLPSQWSS